MFLECSFIKVTFPPPVKLDPTFKKQFFWCAADYNIYIPRNDDDVRAEDGWDYRVMESNLRNNNILTEEWAKKNHQGKIWYSSGAPSTPFPLRTCFFTCARNTRVPLNVLSRACFFFFFYCACLQFNCDVKDEGSREFSRMMRPTTINSYLFYFVFLLTRRQLRRSLAYEKRLLGVKNRRC